jgi:hypothetical protein
MSSIALSRCGVGALLLCIVLQAPSASPTARDGAEGSTGDPPATLEDIYGDTGNAFQAAIGFVNFQGTPNSQAQQSYGLAVDDMVVKWREFVLDPDATDCEASGSCAVITLETTNVFEAQTVLKITVLETTPDDVNDCDLDGTPDGTTDCNGNGVRDIVVESTSAADVAGEISILDQVVGQLYEGQLTVSSLIDVPGVLFIAPQGSDDPTITVTYLDRDVDPGPDVEPCPSSNNPAKHGLVQTTTTIFLGATCEVVVAYPVIVDNGDGDVFADTEETVDMGLCYLNNCGIDLHNCVGAVFSSSPYVECIVVSTLDMGDIEDSSVVQCTPGAFRWKAEDVDRGTLGLTVDDPLQAVFGFTMTCDEIDALSVPQEVVIDLDLDFDAHGEMPSPWVESFEGGTLDASAFFAENLDAGLPGNNNTEGLLLSDGWRCQYSDPDWPNSNSYGSGNAADCFPGMNLPHANATYWQVDGFDTGAPDGGRAKSGSYSMYYGVYLPSDADFTTPMAVVESAAVTETINVGVDSPELSFWHQMSTMDERYVESNVDRGVVQVKTVDLAGQDTSDWANLEPFQNTYDGQNYQWYFNCMFDPVDDGTTEDDFFDPDDPNRRYGPSSTCYPTFTWSCQGDTDDPFQVDNICQATTPPSAGDAPSLGVGTWVESKVDLRRLRGRRIQLRFLVASIKASAETHDDQFDGVNPGPWDDGWWIDDVTVSETLASPATLELDDKVLRHCAGDVSIGCLTDQDCVDSGTTGPCEGEAPQCPATCTSLTLVVATDPDDTGGALDEILVAPGRPIEFDASASYGTCLEGTLQFRLSIDGGPVLRGFSDNPIFLEAPQRDTDYRVEVRCSSATDCADSAVVDVDVACPSSGNLGEIFPVIRAQDEVTWSWTPAKSYLLWRGGLALVGSYAGSQTPGTGTSFTDVAQPVSGAGYYYVLREVGDYCNDQGPWTSGGPSESPARESSLP